MSFTLLKKSKRSMTILIVLVLMLSALLSGCGVENLLQDLASDYVQIKLNHELQSESYRNEQLYTYQIDASIINNYFLDLQDAEISIVVPSEIGIKEGNTKIKEKIKCGEEKNFTWDITVKPSTQDKNVEFLVTLSSQQVSTVVAYDSIFVDGINQNDNRLDFSVDTWNFENYTVKPIPLNQDDYNALCLKLNAVEIADIKERIKGGARGQCYGMAITTILAKSNRLNIARLQDNVANLHAVSKNKESKSSIAYYYLTQFLNPAKDKITQYNSMDSEQKLNSLIDLSTSVGKGGTPVLLVFYLEGGGGHAVVAFGNEKCKEEYNGKTYNNRILIYDNNFPDYFEYLYYNSSNEWVILYKDNKDNTYMPYNTSDLGFITANMEEIDISNLEQNRKSIYSYLTSRDNANIEVSSNGTTWKINGRDTHGSDDVVAYYDIDAADNSSLNIAIKRGDTEAEYSVKSQDESKDLNMSISYDNFYISAKAEGDDKVNLSPEGIVDIEGETSDFNLSITANSGYAPLSWTTISVDAKNGDDPRLKITEGGYLLSGINLKDVSVYAENASSANKLTLDTKESQVYITQEGDNLVVKSDEDKDGKYETILVTGTVTPPDDPMKGGSGFNLGSIFNFGSGFKFGGGSGSSDLWIIILIAGVLLVSVIATAIIVAFRSKKKKNEDAFEVPVIDNVEPIEKNEDEKENNNAILNGIQVLTGSMEGRQFELVDGKTYTVGKDSNLANILFDASYNMVSRVHCTITYSAKFDKYFVIDCSSNGTFLQNGVRISKNTRTPIARGTIVKLADDSCTIKFI